MYKFLSGLNESYENTNDQIFMTRSLPNINQAYAMIVNVESQRKSCCAINTSVDVDGSEPAALLSSKVNNSGGNNNGGNNNYKSRNNFNYGRHVIQCDYCKLKGVTRDNCNKLHGYPATFKYKKKGGSTTLMLTMWLT